jgi:MYXO-CTERM domain-containing protein
MRARSFGIAFLSLSAAVLARPAAAAVTQPDGVVMPLPNPSGEVGLQELFDFKEGQGVLDAKADAGTEPSTFRPLCDFTAQLLLHETGNRSAFVGWYNSPKDDIAPTTVCDEQTGMSSGGGPCTSKDIFVLIRGDVADPPFGKAADPLSHPGQIFTGDELAASPYYEGGEIGFVLMSTQGHFSEKRLNPACTGSTCTAGDRWIPTIIYASKTIPRGYYMCSEDQDVGPTNWGGNDGDFNDYVFLFTGLACSGSGQACDTGQPGICAAGLTDCAGADGKSECRPARTPGAEACNGLDDDCDGDTDEGDELCPVGELCVKARCVPRCGTGEFRCDVDHQCVAGACLEKACLDVSCAAGKVCVAGQCLGACDGVTCPTGQSCADGVCVDPCQGIDCGEGFVCEDGACLVECSCAGCAQGECDPSSGHCVDAGCAGVACDDGKHCAAGHCEDDCAEAHCPGGASCEVGACLPPTTGSDADPGTAIGQAGAAPDLSGGGTSSAAGSGGHATSGGSASGSDPGASQGSPSDSSKSGCACSLPGAAGAGSRWLPLLGLALGALRQRRRGYKK